MVLLKKKKRKFKFKKKMPERPCNCAWVGGAGVGRRKVNMGNQASKTTCVQQVRMKQPRATGAQYSAEGKGKRCYAVYNWARATGGKNHQTCKFTGCRISKHRGFHRRVARKRSKRRVVRRRKVVRKRRSRPSCSCAWIRGAGVGRRKVNMG